MQNSRGVTSAALPGKAGLRSGQRAWPHEIREKVAWLGRFLSSIAPHAGQAVRKELRCLPESLRKLAFGGLGAATLQSGSALRHSLAYRLDLLTRVAPATTVGRQIDDLRVDAKGLGRLDLISFRSTMSQTPARSGRSQVRRKD